MQKFTFEIEKKKNKCIYRFKIYTSERVTFNVLKLEIYPINN
jgi:hypothetical protein